MLPDLRPAHLGWLSNEWQEFNRCFAKKRLKDSAGRYEEGTKNYLGIVGLNENIKMLQEFGMENVECRILDMTNYLIESLKDRKFEVLPRGRGSGIVAFRKKGISSRYLFETLQKKGFRLSLRENWLRVSPHFYIWKEEIDELLKVLSATRISDITHR